ncbi:MAG: hypothetical protein SFY96_12025 [Planctomycetota bacterium]|nr:hypothetical protein [Planctomycetota bacterium]
MLKLCTCVMVAAFAAAAAGQPAAVSQPGAPAAKLDVAHAQTLGIGDRAPSLEGVKWLAGDALGAASRGGAEGKSGVTVVAFWSSWSAASREAMRVLGRVQRENKEQGVRVGAVCVWPRDKNEDCSGLIAKWSQRWPIALGTDMEGAAAKRWLDAAGRESVPMAFVIGADGNVAWIGSPFEGLGEIVRRAVAGTLDSAATKRRLERTQRLDELAGKSMIPGALALTEQLLSEDGALFGYLAGFKFRLLLREREASVSAFAFAREAMQTYLKDNPEELNALACAILDHKDRDVSLALEMARRAASVLEAARDEDASVLDTLARAEHEHGDTEAAIATQERAVALADEGRMKKTMQKRLEKYKAAGGVQGPPKISGQ